MIKYVWLFVSLACIVWYLVILGFVAVKGGIDIRDMLKKLSADAPDKDPVDKEL